MSLPNIRSDLLVRKCGHPVPEEKGHPELDRYICLKHLHTLIPPSYRVVGFAAVLLYPGSSEEATVGIADKNFDERFKSYKGVAFLCIKEEGGKAKALTVSRHEFIDDTVAAKLKYEDSVVIKEPSRVQEGESEYEYNMFEHRVSLDSSGVGSALWFYVCCS